jgi:hypothetical protein
MLMLRYWHSRFFTISGTPLRSRSTIRLGSDVLSIISVFRVASSSSGVSRSFNNGVPFPNAFGVRGRNDSSDSLVV